MLEAERFDVVVSDILTLAPALAAERAGLRRATLIPHVYPVHEEGLPFFAIGALAPRTPSGAALWRRALPVLLGGLQQGRDELNRSRAVVGPAAAGALPRRDLRAAGAGGDVPAARVPAPVAGLGAGDRTDALRAPPPRRPGAGRRRAAGGRGALDGAGSRRAAGARRARGARRRAGPRARDDQPRGGEPLPEAPANAVVVEWLSYSQAMAVADLVVCHGGHGTVARALGAGVPVLCCPAVGDMAENGARVAWSGAGLMLPWRLTSPRRAAARGAQGARRAPLPDPRGRDRRLGGRKRRRRAGAELVEELART